MCGAGWFAQKTTGAVLTRSMSPIVAQTCVSYARRREKRPLRAYQSRKSSIRTVDAVWKSITQWYIAIHCKAVT